MAGTHPSQEDELRETIARLTRRLAEAEAALDAARAGKTSGALRNERLEALGARASAIAHDLNNVFAPIMMAVSLLRPKVTDEKAMRVLTVLGENAERGAELVRQVLAIEPGAEGGRASAQAPRSRRRG
ncbi:MAG TPA: hypothetical protein VKG78_00340 [Opitutaceae bacterium]|nr:hypothetical protein [Opitutaceae bacterium]